MQVVFLFFDSKAAMTKVFTEVCILKWEELTLIAFASESAPNVFFRSHLYQFFWLVLSCSWFYSKNK